MNFVLQKTFKPHLEKPHHSWVCFLCFHSSQLKDSINPYCKNCVWFVLEDNFYKFTASDERLD